jgi:hypothetical protein
VVDVGKAEKPGRGEQATSVNDTTTGNTSVNTVSTGKDRGSRESVNGVIGVTGGDDITTYTCRECSGADIGQMNGRNICMDCLMAGRGIGHVSSEEGGQ